MRVSPLRESVFVTLDNTGNATGSIGPNTSNQVWKISRITVNATGAIEPLVKIYNDSVSLSSFIDGTSRGLSDVAEYPSPLLLHAGQTLVIVWLKGQPGGQGSLYLTGEKEIA